MTGDPATDPTDETPERAAGSPTAGTDESGLWSELTPGHRLSESLTIGNRVVVRYRLTDGSRERATDYVGELIARNRDFLIVDTRTERVKLIRADVLAAKDVPPAASHAGPAHRRVSVDDLQKLMAKGWVATTQSGLGDWVLRSASGYTGRANSVLVVGDSTLPVDKAIDFSERWYAERDASALFQLPGEQGFEVADHPVGAALLERGYVAGAGRPDWDRVLVMTAPSAGVPSLTTESAPVQAEGVLSPEWLMTYAEQRPVVPGVTEAVLSGSEGQLFLSVRHPSGRGIIALARMAIHPGWGGIYGVWVHPEHRRQGLATAMTSAMALVAKENTMAALYLQVSGDNADAISLYESLGFSVHHEYTYLARPTD